MILVGLGNRSYECYSSTSNGTTNLNVDNNPHYKDTLKLNRDYRLRKSVKQVETNPDDVQNGLKNVDPNYLDDGYISKAQKFVERNKDVIESGAMFQRQQLPLKSKIRLTDIIKFMLICHVITTSCSLCSVKSYLTCMRHYGCFKCPWSLMLSYI